MSVKLLVTGDFCPINRNESLIKENKFSLIFGDLQEKIKNADLAITNLECPLTDINKGIDKTGPCLKAPLSAGKALKFAGFNLVTLANNHIMDFGSVGLKQTMDVLKANEIKFVGAGNSLNSAQKPFIFKKDGIIIGLLNYAENEFCTTKGAEYGANPLDPIKNHYDIKQLRGKVDFLMVIVHGGREHYQLPTPRIRKTFRFFIDSGADAVISHHTHCFSGFEDYKGKRIFYGLGNFVFDYKKKYQTGNWTKGLALDITLGKQGASYEIIPFKQGQLRKSTIELLTKEEKDLFEINIGELNKIIADDQAFMDNWLTYIKSQKAVYKALLYVPSKYLRKLMSLKILPNIYFRSKNRETLLLNLFKCETHHEIMTEILDRKIP